MRDIKELRELAALSRPAFANYFNIPYRTLQSWELGEREIPTYLLELIEYKLVKEGVIK